MSRLLVWTFLVATAVTLCPAAPALAQDTSTPDTVAGATQAGPAKGSSRGLFLATLGSLLVQNAGAAVAQGVSGLITRWFDKVPGPSGANNGSPGSSGYTDNSNKVSSAQPYVANGAAPSGGQGDGTSTLYAGMAYEVHTLDRNGQSAPVDPATYAFQTGDRFKVFYRPSLPGQVRVSNINPQGSETLIETLDVAAGELVTLGPYEFSDTKGDDILRLVLSPCSSDKLMAATRNIVKVGQGGSASDNAAARLGVCGTNAVTRGARKKVRDIRKVQREGSTSFALDPVAPSEIASGAITPREVSIHLAHR